jgi:hypothetical protein
MGIAGKVVFGLLMVAGALLVPTPAYADVPSLAVDSITYTPGGGEVRQTITYRNLPEHSTIRYEVNRDWGLTVRRPDGTACAMPLPYVGDCSELSGSGVVYVAFGNDIPSNVVFSAATNVGTAQARIDALSLVATGTVTAAAKADLTVNFTPGYQGAFLTVYSYGPSVSSAETLRISGFTQPVNVPTGTCELDGLVIVCYLRELATTPSQSSPTCATGRYPSCRSFTLTLGAGTPPPLTATVSGPLPDPDPSNNSKVIFANSAGNPPPPPPPAPGPAPGGGTGGGGGSTGGGAGGQPDAPPPTLAAGTDVTPAANETSPTAPVFAATELDAAGTVTGPETRSATATVAVAATTFIVGAGLGGIGWFTWWRLRRRPGSPPGLDPPTLVG